MIFNFLLWIYHLHTLSYYLRFIHVRSQYNVSFIDIPYKNVKVIFYSKIMKANLLHSPYVVPGSNFLWNEFLWRRFCSCRELMKLAFVSNVSFIMFIHTFNLSNRLRTHVFDDNFILLMISYSEWFILWVFLSWIYSKNASDRKINQI